MGWTFEKTAENEELGWVWGGEDLSSSGCTNKGTPVFLLFQDGGIPQIMMQKSLSGSSELFVLSLCHETLADLQIAALSADISCCLSVAQIVASLNICLTTIILFHLFSFIHVP